MIRRTEWPLFLLALAIAVGIKFAVHDREQISERIVEAQVIYSPPAPNYVSYELVDKVRIGVRGKSNDISRLSSFAVEVGATIPSGRIGPTEIVLEEKDVRFNIKADFAIFSIDPKKITIKVEPLVSVDVPIAVRFFGEPAAGAQHGEPFVNPPRARLRGPASRVARIDELDVLVGLNGHARSFSETVSLSSPDPVVQVVEPGTVQVAVPMAEPELSIRYDTLPAAPNPAGPSPPGQPPGRRKP